MSNQQNPEPQTHEETDMIIRQHLAERYWDTTHSLRVEHTETKNFVSAAINNLNWSIYVNLSPNFEAEQLRVVNDAGLPMSEPVSKALYALLVHEEGHWSLSPRDFQYAEMILNSVSKGLKFAGFDEKKVEDYAPYVANLYEDIVINSINGMSDERFREGISILMTDRAYFPKSKKPQYSADYFAMFVDAQFKLIGSDYSRGLAERYYKKYSKIEGACKKLLASVIGDEYAEKAFSDSLTDQDRTMVRRILRDETKWSSAARELAIIIAPHIKDKKKDMEQNVSLSVFNGAMADGNKGEKEGDPAQAQKKRIREGIIKAGLERLKREHGDDFGIGKNDLPYASEYEIYDNIYKRMAGEIVLEFMKEGEEEQRLRLFHMANRRLEEDEPITGSMAWDRTLFIGDQPILFRKDMPHSVPLQGAEGHGSFEGMLFKVDVSESMGWSGKALDGSKYDMCIRSIYGTINYLEKVNKAQFLKYGLLLFSDTTTWSGWLGYGELDKLKHQLFTGYQAGGTCLDPAKVGEAMRSNKDRFLTLMTSDGKIMNTEEAFAACKKIMDRPNDFVLIQVQSHSNFGELVRDSGGLVVDVSNPEDLVGLNLTIIDSKYGTSGSRAELKKVARTDSQLAAQSQHRKRLSI